MANANDVYGIHAGDLQLDWDAMAVETGIKSIKRAKRRSVMKIAGVAVMLMFTAVMFVKRDKTTDIKYDMLAYYAVPGDYESYSIPKNLQVLSGYPESYDGSLVHNFIAGND